VATGAAVAQAFGRFTYGVLLPAVRDDFGISNTMAGSVGALNVGAYLAGTLAVAAVSSRLRLITVMRIGFLFSTAGLTMAAISPNVGVFGASMLLSGFGGACIWIPAPVIAADAMAPERRAMAIGLMGSGIGAGIVFTSQLSSLVRSVAGDHAWRTVYGVEAGIAVVVLFVTLSLLGHDQPHPGNRATSNKASKDLGGFNSLRQMRGWVPLTLSYTTFGLMYLLVIGYLTTRLEDDSGWSGAKASLAFTMLGVAVIAGGPMFVAIRRRLGPARSLALAFSCWATLAIAVLGGWTIPTLLAAMGLGLLFSGIPSMITVFVVENTTSDSYGPSFAAATLAFGIAQMISPQLGGLIADLSGSFTLVFALSSGLGIVGAIVAIQMPSTAVNYAKTPATTQRN